jgi:hypothetical protein
MTVEKLIEFLKNEIQDEEIIFLLPNGEEMLLDSKPPRHGGPQRFYDEEGNEYHKSTVLIWLRDMK